LLINEKRKRGRVARQKGRGSEKGKRASTGKSKDAGAKKKGKVFYRE